MSLSFARPIRDPFLPTQGWYAHRVTLNTQHQAMDFSAPVGTPIYAVAPGIVLAARFHEHAGNFVLLQHTGPYKGFYSRYLHQSRLVVHKGDSVSQKQLLGYSGDTGLSDAPHLHFDMQATLALIAKLRRQGLRHKGKKISGTQGYNIPVEHFIAGTGDPKKWVQLGAPANESGGVIALAAVTLLLLA